MNGECHTIDVTFSITSLVPIDDDVRGCRATTHHFVICQKNMLERMRGCDVVGGGQWDS